MQGSSPSLQRARKPYNLGNFLIGSSLALFAAGVYSYSISSVKQDDFVSCSMPASVKVTDGKAPCGNVQSRAS